MIKLRKLFTPVEAMDADAARKYITEQPEGTYTLLDVRQPWEYEKRKAARPRAALEKPPRKKPADQRPVTSMPESDRARTVRSLMKSAIVRLQESGFDEARLTVELLLAHVLHCQRIALYTDSNRSLAETDCSRLRRASGSPDAA